MTSCHDTPGAPLWPFPVAGGPGTRGVPVAGGEAVPVAPGAIVGVVVTVAGTGVRVTAVGVPVGEADADGVAVTVPGVLEGVDVAVVADVAVAVGVADVAVADGVAVEGTTWLLTVDEQFTKAPPPLPEPLHWSTLTARDEVIVEPVVTVQMNPTLVPPLPEPLHCPTVAAETEVTPGVLAGVQLPGPPVPVITDPMH